MSKNILIVEARFYDALADALVEGAVHVLEEPGTVPLDRVATGTAAPLPGVDIRLQLGILEIGARPPDGVLQPAFLLERLCDERPRTHEHVAAVAVVVERR